MKPAASPRRKPGRPLSFDREAALERAMLAFWETGFETTSVAELTAAMGVTAPSLYAAFGDKKGLFLEALRRYTGDPAEMARSFAAAPTARDAVAQMLAEAAVLFTGETTPRGCLLASAVATGSKEAADVRAAAAAERAAIREIIVARVERDIAAGLLPKGTAPGALADMALAVTQGMSVLARDGAERGALLALCEAALAGWPAAPA
ncbi:TetR/AcrR family transcriptional regulator [Pseudoroseicyclus sp. H15]